MILAPGYTLLGNDIFGTLSCPRCGHTQKLDNGYADHHWLSNVLPAIHCDGCLHNASGHLPSTQLKQANQARRINGHPTQAQIDATKK